MSSQPRRQRTTADDGGGQAGDDDDGRAATTTTTDNEATKSWFLAGIVVRPHPRLQVRALLLGGSLLLME